MKRFHVLGWIFATLLLGFIVGRYRSTAPTQAHAWAVARAEAATVRTDMPITLDVRDMPLRQFVAELEQAAGVPVSLDQKALEMNSIDIETPVTMRCVNEPLDDVIERLDFKVVATDVYVAAGQIVVTTAEEAAHHSVETRIYDVLPLIAMLQRRASASGIGLPTFAGFTFTLPAPSPSGVVGPPQPATASQWAESLGNLIEDRVATDTWKNNGGTISALSEINGFLVIGTTAKHHREIAALLDTLMQADTSQRDPSRPPDRTGVPLN